MTRYITTGTQSDINAIRETLAPNFDTSKIQTWPGCGDLIEFSLTEEMIDELRTRTDDQDWCIDEDGIMWAAGTPFEFTIDRNAL